MSILVSSVPAKPLQNWNVESEKIFERRIEFQNTKKVFEAFFYRLCLPLKFEASSAELCLV
jgi:hypothetical protein